MRRASSGQGGSFRDERKSFGSNPTNQLCLESSRPPNITHRESCIEKYYRLFGHWGGPRNRVHGMLVQQREAMWGKTLARGSTTRTPLFWLHGLPHWTFPTGGGGEDYRRQNWGLCEALIKRGCTCYYHKPATTCSEVQGGAGVPASLVQAVKERPVPEHLGLNCRRAGGLSLSSLSVRIFALSCIVSRTITASLC